MARQADQGELHRIVLQRAVGQDTRDDAAQGRHVQLHHFAEGRFVAELDPALEMLAFLAERLQDG